MNILERENKKKTRTILDEDYEEENENNIYPFSQRLTIRLTVNDYYWGFISRLTDKNDYDFSNISLLYPFSQRLTIRLTVNDYYWGFISRLTDKNDYDFFDLLPQKRVTKIEKEEYKE